MESSRQKVLSMKIQKCYQDVSSYLTKKLPLKDAFVKYSKCLHPEAKDQKSAIKMTDDVTIVTDEWKVYREEEVKDSVLYKDDESLKVVDQY